MPRIVSRTLHIDSRFSRRSHRSNDLVTTQTVALFGTLVHSAVRCDRGPSNRPQFGAQNLPSDFRPAPGVHVQRQSLRHDLIDVSIGQIHVEQVAPGGGSGAPHPTLVLLPQWPFGGWHYRKALPLLARSFRPVAVDLPGFGWSSAPEEALTVDDHAKVLAELLQVLGLEDVTVLARAASTAVAVRLASHAPLAGLILHGPFAHTTEQRAAKLQHTWRPIAHSRDSGHLVQAWERVASRYPDLPPELLTRCAMAHIDASEVQAAAYRDVWRTDTLAALAELRVPACAFVGRDEVLTYCFDNLPSNVVRVDGPGLAGPSDHLPWTDPGEFADLVEEAFASLGRGR